MLALTHQTPTPTKTINASEDSRLAPTKPIATPVLELGSRNLQTPQMGGPLSAEIILGTRLRVLQLRHRNTIELISGIGDLKYFW